MKWYIIKITIVILRMIKKFNQNNNSLQLIPTFNSTILMMTCQYAFKASVTGHTFIITPRAVWVLESNTSSTSFHLCTSLEWDRSYIWVRQNNKFLHTLLVKDFHAGDWCFVLKNLYVLYDNRFDLGSMSFVYWLQNSSVIWEKKQKSKLHIYIYMYN